MTINELQEQIIEEFSIFDEWMDKYQYVIDIASTMPEIKAEHRTDQYIIKGCQSRVWIDAQMLDGHIFYTADSDAIITKGIIALLIRVMNNHTPQEILDADLYFIDKIGLKENLSPTRANGLVAMIKQMKMFALAFNTKQQ